MGVVMLKIAHVITRHTLNDIQGINCMHIVNGFPMISGLHTGVIVFTLLLTLMCS